MYIPKAKSGSIVRADFARIQYAQTGIFVVIFDPISERDIPGRVPSWIRIFIICKHTNQLRHKIERINAGVSSGERDAGPPKSRPACGKRVLYSATEFVSSPNRCNLRTVLFHGRRKTGQVWSGRPSGRGRWTHSCFPGPAGFESRFPCL